MHAFWDPYAVERLSRIKNKHVNNCSLILLMLGPEIWRRGSVCIELNQWSTMAEVALFWTRWLAANCKLGSHTMELPSIKGLIKTWIFNPGIEGAVIIRERITKEGIPAYGIRARPNSGTSRMFFPWGSYTNNDITKTTAQYYRTLGGDIEAVWPNAVYPESSHCQTTYSSAIVMAWA